MSIVDLNDLPLFRRIIGYQDICKWNDAVKRYMNEYFPDARLRYVAKECCWKVRNSEIDFFVDVRAMIDRSNISLQWSGKELDEKLLRVCKRLETIKANYSTTQHVSFCDEADDSSQAHLVELGESRFSKCCLGFSPETWIQVIRMYLRDKTDVRVDFSKSEFGDDYVDFYNNLRTHASSVVIDIEVALYDFLNSKHFLEVDYNDLPTVRKCLGVVNGRWLHMLREYMNKYHSDLSLTWCPHSHNENAMCECGEPTYESGIVKVNVLRMLIDFHAKRDF